MAPQRERRGSGHGSIFFDERKQKWIGQLPRDEIGRRPKVSGDSEADVQRKLYRLSGAARARITVGRPDDGGSVPRGVGA